MNDKTPPPAEADPLPEITSMARNAASVIQTMANVTGYSLLELGAMFRVAAQMCDEQSALLDKAALSRRFRRF